MPHLDLASAAVLLLNGLASASTLFIVASGLSLIFGVTRIVNFAHGSFYMLGAFVAYSLVTALPRTGLAFVVRRAAAAVAIRLVGGAVEMVILRRISRAPELFQVLATFGVVLIIQDAALWIWGSEELLGPRVPGWRGAVLILGQLFPEYNLAIIAVGPVVLGLLWLLFHRTRWGVLVRAATQDREMVAALGVNQKWLFTSVFFLGAALAGLGGALQVPRDAANLTMDINSIAEAFVVVVVGGMGSIAGAFLAALLIGVLQAFGILIFPKLTLVLVFLVMAIVLVIRPHGLLGRPEAWARGLTGDAPPLIRAADRALVIAALVALALLIAAPAVVGDYALVLLIETLVFVLFAASLHLLMGPGGMVSFGHAAYFGLGAYGAALLVKYAALPMVPALAAAPLIAAVGALAFGWFCVRLSGVYLAMLRADAIGIDVRTQQWLAFALAGAFAGLAGGLFAFAKGSVFPQAASIPTSIDGLVMVLLGGVQTLTGPIVGAAVYHWLEAEIMRATDYWRALVGLAILALVLAFPQGLAGAARSLRDRVSS